MFVCGLLRFFSCFLFLLSEGGFKSGSAEGHQKEVIKITTEFRKLNTSKPLTFSPWLLELS